MTPQTVILFLGSSDELKEDREEFRIFISVENDRLNRRNIYIQLVQWEYLPSAVSKTSSQNDYNKLVAESDLAVFLFHTKAGQYTVEEFNTAYRSFKDSDKPLIWTYFRQEPATAPANESLTEFKNNIDKMGHFYCKYTSIDDLKNQFRIQLDYFLEKRIPEKSKDEQNAQINQVAEKIINIGSIDNATFN
jgi:hypothetical protein